MMKNKSKIIALAILACATCATTVTSTVAWFKYGSDVDFGQGNNIALKAGTEANFFSKGDGSEEKPYEIKTRTQLYNLAWLQYTGYFNLEKDEDGNVIPGSNNIEAPHFKLMNSINMEGITLPPIGTEKYPFFGTFDGGGFTISDLTVSNDDPTNSDSDFGSSKPSTIPDHATQPRVVGFFGAVGYIPTNDILTSSDYSSVTTSLFNVTLENLTVLSRTDEVLIGLAAGYVNGQMNNVKVSGESKFNVNGQTAVDTEITSQLSDYGLVGYAEEDYTSTGGQSTQKISEYYDNTLDPAGKDDEWGGSINMYSTYSRLRSIYSSIQNTTQCDFFTTQKFVNGVASGNPVRNRYPENNGNTYQSFRCSNQINSHYIGNFRFCTDSSKVYMMGGTYQIDEYFKSSTGRYITDGTHYLNSTATNSTSTQLNNSCKWDFYTTNGKTYIRVYDETNRRWIYLADSQASNTTNKIHALSTVNGSDTSPNTVPSGATEWTISGSGNSYRIEHGNYRLAYIEGDGTTTYGWKCYDVDTVIPAVTAHSNVYYTSSNTKYYINSTDVDDGDYFTTTAISGVASDDVYFDTFVDNVQVVVHKKNSNTPLYLLARYEGGGYRIYVSTSATQNGYFPLYYYTGNYIRTNTAFNNNNGTNNGTRNYVYLRADTNGFRVGTRGSNQTNSTTYYSVSVETFTASPQITYGDYYLAEQQPQAAADVFDPDHTDTSGMKFKAEDTSYFPLTVYDSDDKEVKEGTHYANEPTDKNTGYFVAGMTGYAYNSIQNNNNRKLEGLRSITLTTYPNSDGRISNSYQYSTTSGATNEISNVKTINFAPNTTTRRVDSITDSNKRDYEKYISTKSKLESVLNKNKGAVYGMHFCNFGGYGDISMDNIVRAKNVSIMGETESEFDLPVYSIDFNLKEQGYINFFSGVYNGGTNNTDSFFTLNRVFRPAKNKEDPTDKSYTTITDIREISAIYQVKDANAPQNDTEAGTQTYIYKYKGLNGLFDKNDVAYTGATSTLTLKFDTSWIGVNKDILLPSGNATTPDFRKYLFYFEIPADEGEYALGNVSGDDGQEHEGCYLLYLDIGANGKTNKDRIYSYSISSIKTTETYPLGVDFAIKTTDDGTGGESMCVLVAAGLSGSVSFEVSAGTVAVGGTTTVVESTTYSISRFAYQNTECEVVAADPPEGGGPPGAVPQPSSIGHVRTRTTYITVVSTDNELNETTTDYWVVSQLSETETITSSVIYTKQKNEETGEMETVTLSLEQLYTAVSDLKIVDEHEVSLYSKLLNASTAIVLEKASGKPAFDVSLPTLPWKVAEAWAAGTIYKVGDVVVRNNTLYICTTAHTATTTFATANWSSFTTTTTNLGIVDLVGKTIVYNITIDDLPPGYEIDVTRLIKELSYYNSQGDEVKCQVVIIINHTVVAIVETTTGTGSSAVTTYTGSYTQPTP